MDVLLVVLGWLVVIGFAYVGVVHVSRTRRARERLQAEHRAAFEALAPVPDEEMSWLRRWLFLAGYRRPEAPAIFLIAVIVALTSGFLLAWGIRNSALMDEALRILYELPGGVGGLMAPILVVGPWVLLIIIASLPWLHVRAARRKRVREVEEDLPITLQILATLARAGLGFDAALVRVLESADLKRTLPAELQTFRREALSGIPRTRAWRRLAQRVEVTSMTIFVSAMVHAEQVGGGLANVLVRQAEDVQSRRRERALVMAQSLPVKLVFPLVLCFLPGIFVWTLGPAAYQFIQVLDSVLRSRG